MASYRAAYANTNVTKIETVLTPHAQNEICLGLFGNLEGLGKFVYFLTRVWNTFSQSPVTINMSMP